MKHDALTEPFEDGTIKFLNEVADRLFTIDYITLNALAFSRLYNSEIRETFCGIGKLVARAIFSKDIDADITYTTMLSPHNLQYLCVARIHQLEAMRDTHLRLLNKATVHVEGLVNLIDGGGYDAN